MIRQCFIFTRFCGCHWRLCCPGGVPGCPLGLELAPFVSLGGPCPALGRSWGGMGLLLWSLSCLISVAFCAFRHELELAGLGCGSSCSQFYSVLAALVFLREYQMFLNDFGWLPVGPVPGLGRSLGGSRGPVGLSRGPCRVQGAREGPSLSRISAWSLFFLMFVCNNWLCLFLFGCVCALLFPGAV